MLEKEFVLKLMNSLEVGWIEDKQGQYSNNISQG